MIEGVIKPENAIMQGAACCHVNGSASHHFIPVLLEISQIFSLLTLA